MSYSTVSTLSTFGLINTQTASTLPGAVADKAVLHELQQMQQQAIADAGSLTQRVLAACEKGPALRTKDSRGLLSAIMRESARSTSDPMQRLSYSLKQRNEEAHELFRKGLPPWARTNVAVLVAPSADALLTTALAVQQLRVRFPVEIAPLRENASRKEAELQSSEASLGLLSAGIETSSLARSTQREGKFSPALMAFARVFGISVAAGIVVGLFTGEWLPYPALIIGAGLLAGLLLYWNRSLADETIDIRGPFAALEDKYVAFANQSEACEAARRRAEQTEAIQQEIERLPDQQPLIDAFDVAFRTLESRIAGYTRRTFSSPSPDMVLLEGQALAEALWQRRSHLWTTGGMNEALADISGCTSVGMLIQSRPRDAADALQAAAQAAMSKITLSETITSLFELENGQRNFLGELRSQRIKLSKLLPIQERKAEMKPAACPAIYHAIVPEQLMEVIKPVLDNAFAKATLDIFPTVEDELLICFETFNWRNEERADHTGRAHSLARHSGAALAERWSCIESFVQHPAAVTALAPVAGQIAIPPTVR